MGDIGKSAKDKKTEKAPSINKGKATINKTISCPPEITTPMPPGSPKSTAYASVVKSIEEFESGEEEEKENTVTLNFNQHEHEENTVMINYSQHEEKIVSMGMSKIEENDVKEPIRIPDLDEKSKEEKESICISDREEVSKGAITISSISEFGDLEQAVMNPGKM